MGSITRSLSNNITTGGVILPAGITNTSVANVTSFSGVTGGGTLTLLSTQTASNSATISFTTGLDSTYNEYIFKFIDIHPRTDSAGFTFNLSTDSGSNYNVTKTTTFFRPYHDEADTATGLGFVAGDDLAQSTAFQTISGSNDIGNDADQSLSGSLTLFNPSSTTYVKHFTSVNNYTAQADYNINSFIGGYANTTSAINAIRFQMSTGNFDGIIKLYGMKKS